MFSHIEYNCKVFLLCEYVCDYLGVLIFKIILDKLYMSKGFLWCVYGYVLLGGLIYRKNIHIPDTEMILQYYGSVCGCISCLLDRMFLHKLHMEKISFHKHVSS